MTKINQMQNNLKAELCSILASVENIEEPFKFRSSLYVVTLLGGPLVKRQNTRLKSAVTTTLNKDYGGFFLFAKVTLQLAGHGK